jgi:hypothetical protein
LGDGQRGFSGRTGMYAGFLAPDTIAGESVNRDGLPISEG